MALRFDQLIDFFFDRPPAYELVYQHILVLSNAERAVRSLVLNRGVPPAIEVDHVRSGGKIEARTPGLEREHEEPHRFVFLKPSHQILSPLHLGLPVKDQSGTPEDRSEEPGKWRRYLPELCEDEHFFLLGGNNLGDIAQTNPFSTVLFAPCAVPQPLRWMIAYLLEPHQERQYQPLALDSLAASSCAASSSTASWYSTACLRLSWQNALTSVLSGRSEITVLSVFSRRKMYGRRSSRRGPYGLWGRSARRLVKPVNCFADPSSPGLIKSKMDHKSPRRFSIGVPVSANLDRALSLLAILVCLAFGFLIACASSRTTRCHAVSASQGMRRSEP